MGEAAVSLVGQQHLVNAGLVTNIIAIGSEQPFSHVRGARLKGPVLDPDRLRVWRSRPYQYHLFMFILRYSPSRLWSSDWSVWQDTDTVRSDSFILMPRVIAFLYK